MTNKDAFFHFHPVVNILYFGFVLAFAMIYTHPVCLALSLICAFAYSIFLNGKKAIKFSLLYMLPMLLVAALLSPVFNHQGITILAYLPDGNPLTLESIAYGIAAAIMLVTVITWFSCFNVIITADKLVYLFGRIIPALSLILSMALRFVPRFKAQIKVISNAQKCIGRDVSDGNLLQKVKHGITIMSIMVTWALENALETADSMKSRGYGLPGRSAFSIYRFDSRDYKALIFIIACVSYIIVGSLSGGLYFRYYPAINGLGSTPYTITIFAVYFALGALPLILNLQEDKTWKSIASRT
ncbi:MAG: energy-coupling factor transporter transmembrane protein EcfT [Clostridiales bacterium]|nr:energy-coupling factor transporter transmembrane protein EcfT [Clostridiales bacterium]